MPVKVYSGQSPPPFALRLFIAFTNSPASISSIITTGDTSAKKMKLHYAN